MSKSREEADKKDENPNEKTVEPEVTKEPEN